MMIAGGRNIAFSTEGLFSALFCGYCHCDGPAHGHPSDL
jgi:hypothetical protein